MPSQLSNARTLRSNSSDAERCLWRFVRNRHLGGYRFRRQMPLGRYIVDFACVRARLVIELDGGQHADCALDDLERTRDLARAGFHVLRFWNDEVLQQTEAVLECIHEALRRACPHPSPLPQAGEGEGLAQVRERERLAQVREGDGLAQVREGEGLAQVREREGLAQVREREK